MRLVVELNPVEQRVEGTVACDGSGEPCPFSGWLELLRVLEASVPVAGRPPEPTDRPPRW